MGNEKLTTIARRLRPFLAQMIEELQIGGGLVTEGPDIDVIGKVVGRGGDQIITFDTAGAPVAEYAPTSAGFDLALGATAPIVWLYGYTISGDHTIPAGYHVIGNQRDTSILSGQITMGTGSSLTNLSVIRTANDANALIGVGGPGTGTGYIYGCKVACTQAGAGAAYAIAANGGLYLYQGDIHAARCELEATSVGGVGYCGLSSAGRIYSRWNKTDVYTTDRWLVS